MKVKDAMHKGAEWVPPSAKLSEIAAIMKKHDIGAVPVGENDRLVGMVTDRDMVCRGIADGKDPAKLTAKDVMTKGVVYCRDNEDLTEAIRTMEQKKIRRLPVISEQKRMIGMLSLGDVSHAGPREMTAEMTRAVSGHHH
jgi:CBS domain-containing protein